jgi:hypothetical protein
MDVANLGIVVLNVEVTNPMGLDITASVPPGGVCGHA